MTEEQNKRCEDNIAFVNSFFQQFSEFRDKTEKTLQNVSAATVSLYSTQEDIKTDLQKLMSEMIRLAKAVENTQKDLTEFKVFVIKHKSSDVSLQVNAKPQPDKNIWDWLKELKK